MEGIHTTRSWVSTDLNGDTPTLLPEDSEIIIKGGTPIMLPEKEKEEGGLFPLGLSNPYESLPTQDSL